MGYDESACAELSECLSDAPPIAPDKRSKSHTKEIYLSHQVDIQPCFNKEVLTELADTAAFNLAELERFNPDKSDYSSK